MNILPKTDSTSEKKNVKLSGGHLARRGRGMGEEIEFGVPLPYVKINVHVCPIPNEDFEVCRICWNFRKKLPYSIGLKKSFTTVNIKKRRDFTILTCSII